MNTILAATDQRGSNYLAPIPNHSKVWGVTFIFITVLFGFFLINLFVGVVVSTFNAEKEKSGLGFLLTKKQQEWLNIKKYCLASKPLMLQLSEQDSTSKHRLWCFQVQKS